MATIIEITADLNTGTSFQTFTKQQQLPIRFDCPTLLPIFYADPKNAWNCIRCNGESPFCMPFVHGDVIPIQMNLTDFQNQDPSIIDNGFVTSSNPIGYVGMKALDRDGNEISKYVDLLATEYHVSHIEGKGSFQTAFLNTDLLPEDLNEFCIKFEYYGENQEIVFQTVSEPFCKVRCKESIIIESMYSEIDCFGRCYIEPDNYVGTSNNAFYNFVRAVGTVEFIEAIPTNDEADNGEILSKELTYRYQVSLSLLPPYFALYLSAAIEGAVVTVNGNELTINGGVQRNNSENRMFVVDLDATATCEISNSSCE